MLRITGATDKGLSREINEDRFAGEVFADGLGYCVVCDGMGGEVGGALAASIACEEVRRMIDSALRSEMQERSIYSLLESAVANANTMVYDKSRQDDETLAGMGCTLCMALVSGARAYIANIGDSRCYLLHAGEFSQLTTDHTLVQLMLDRGEITPQEAQNHPDRHFITKAVGVRQSIEPAYTSLELSPGDALLVCSDGLYNMLDDEKLMTLTARAAREDDCSALIDEANIAGGYDNITAVVIYNK